MVKRKQSPFLSPDMVRTVGLVGVILLGIALAAVVLVVALRHVCASSLFTVHGVVIADNIQPLELPELAKAKGQNLFSVDLFKMESRIRTRYPQLADVRVLRQFPDQILVTAIRRDPFAKVLLDGRLSVIDRDGYMMGPPVDGQQSLTIIKGLKRQKVLAGDQIKDERLKFAAAIITAFHQDKRLAAVGLEAVKVDDQTRIVCDLGIEGSEFQVVIDKDNIAGRLKTLSEVLSRGGLDLTRIKYMDLRFGEPILGQKKVKK